MLRKASQAFVILVCLRCALPTAADLACTPFDITIGKCAVIRDPFGTRLCILDMTKGARPSNLTSITLLSIFLLSGTIFRNILGRGVERPIVAAEH